MSEITVRDAFGLFFLGGGLLFSALGVLGLFRMPDVYTRMHAAAKTICMGSAMTLLGVAVLASTHIALKAIATMIFVYLTSPIATTAAARAAHRRREPMSFNTVQDDLERDRDPRHLAEHEPYHVD